MAATKKISELVTASPLTGVELVPIVQGGQTVQSNADAFKTFSVAGVEAEVSTLDIRVTNLESNVAAVSVLTTFTQTGTGAVLRSGQDKMRDIINAKDFGVVGDGIADDTEALRRAVAAAAGRTLVLTGTFLVKGTVTVTSSFTHIVGEGTARIVADPNTTWATGQPIISIRGPTPPATTTLTAAITSASSTLTVANAANLTPGTFFQIASNGEYWNGVTGVSGYQPVNKSELNRVQSVSGNVITPEWGFADTYSTTGYTVTIRPYTFIEGIRIENIEVYGTGYGDLNTVFDMPQGIYAIYVNDISIVNCRIANCQNTIIELELTNNARVLGNEITGRVLSDPSNLPVISGGFYGVIFTGSCNWVFANNTCQSLRRAIDANATSGFPIPRNGIVANNTAVTCANGFGTHQSENIVFANNVAINCGAGLYFRGKNATIIGNRFEAVGTNASDANIIIGGGSATNYADNPEAKRIIIANNYLKCAGQGIRIQVDVDSAIITGNTIYNGSNHGISFTGKRTRNVIVSDNFVDITNRSGPRHCFFLENEDNRNLVLKNIVVKDNTFLNGDDIIRINAPIDPANAASNIIIKDNLMGSTSGTFSRAIRYVIGFFGKNIIFKDNIYDGVVGGTGIQIDGVAPNFELAPDIGDNTYSNFTQQTVGFLASPTLQTSLTAEAGQRIINNAPAPGGYMGWVCTSSGVAGGLGTANGGTVTGDITSGTDQLTVSSINNSSIFVGAYLTIPGAGVAGAALATRVTAVNVLVVTVADNASTTVTGAVIAYTNPVFKGFGLIET